MKKIFVSTMVVAVAFLTGCASNGYVQQPQLQQQVQPQQVQVAAQTAPTKTLRSFESQKNDKDGKVRCHLVFSDESTFDIYGGTCAEKAEEVKLFQAPAQKVTYVTAPAQQQVVVAAPTSSFWDMPLVRGIRGALGGAVTGVVASNIVGGDKDDRKIAGFAGAVTGAVIDVASSPSWGGGQSGGVQYQPTMLQQPYYGYNGYVSPETAFLNYKAAVASETAQTATAIFRMCSATYGAYHPMCQR